VDVREAIEKRRSIKRFAAEHRLRPDEVAELLRLARLAPSAFNVQHCRYVVVEDPDRRRRLREVSFDQPQVTDASLLVVVCGDVRAWQKEPARYWSHLPAGARDGLVRMIHDFYAGDEQLQRDECMRSCGLAAMTLMLAAQGLGYDSCPLDGYDPAAVARLIDLPADHLLCMFVAIGRALEPAPARGGQLPAAVTILRNSF
jgi:nitroreductase